MKRSATGLRRSLRASFFDASFHASMMGFGESYFPAFALLLGASPFEIGVLATVPILLGAIFQVFSTPASHRIGDRVWVIGSAVLQALIYIPIALLARTMGGAYPVLLGWVCFYWMLNLGISPAWNAWMGRMVPATIRSRYFGRRNVSVHSLIFLSLLAGGFLIDAAERSRFGAAIGFMSAFTLAALSRGVSVWFLARQHDPGTGVQVERRPLRELLTGFAQQPYGRLILLLVLINGSVHISAAYFVPYMLHELNLSYARYTILNGAIVAARVLASTYWGEIASEFGNRRALQVSAVLLIPLPSLWIISNNFAYLIGLQLFGGFAWAGFELAGFLTLFDCTTDHNRAQVLSIYNLLNGALMVTGSMFGGAVLHALGTVGYPCIFLMSSACRALVIWRLASGVGVRRRRLEPSFGNTFVRVMTFRPSQGEGLRPEATPEV